MTLNVPNVPPANSPTPPKRSDTCPVPVPVPVPDNCQTACDDRLRAGPLREPGQPPGFGPEFTFLKTGVLFPVLPHNLLL